MNFATFKTLYGHSEMGPKLVKIGNEMLKVDNSAYTYNVVSEKDNESKKRLLQGTIASKQRFDYGDRKLSTLRSISDGVTLPLMKSTTKLPEAMTISKQ